MFAAIPESSGGTHKQTHAHDTQLFPAGRDSQRPNKQDKHTYMRGVCFVRNCSEYSRTASLGTAGCRATSPVVASLGRSMSLWFRWWGGEQVSADPTQLSGSFGSLLAARQAWGQPAGNSSSRKQGCEQIVKFIQAFFFFFLTKVNTSRGGNRRAALMPYLKQFLLKSHSAAHQIQKTYQLGPDLGQLALSMPVRLDLQGWQ